MDTATIIFLLIADLPIFLLFGWLVFGNWRGFLETLWYALSACGWDYDYGDEAPKLWWALLKVLWFLVTVAAVIGAEFAMARGR